MDSKFLNFLLVMAFAAFIGFGSTSAQNPIGGSSDANGSAVTAPARQSDASVSPSSTSNANSVRRDAQQAAHAAVANDRGTVPGNQAVGLPFNLGWLGLFGLLGLLGLVRRRAGQERRVESERYHEDLPRAA